MYYSTWQKMGDYAGLPSGPNVITSMVFIRGRQEVWNQREGEMIEAEIREKNLKVIHCWLSRCRQRQQAEEVGGREELVAIEAKRD